MDKRDKEEIRNILGRMEKELDKFLEIVEPKNFFNEMLINSFKGFVNCLRGYVKFNCGEDDGKL